jgi:hypothetical protein
MTAMRDNPTAISEGSTDAPVNQTGWHPYDMVNVGDGADGEFYDFSVDGTSAAISSPAFEDGYEYALVLEDFQIAAPSSSTLTIEGGHTGVTYRTLDTYATPGIGFVLNAVVTLRFARLPDGTTAGNKGVYSSFRVSSTSGSAAGKLYLLRRREFFSG